MTNIVITYNFYQLISFFDQSRLFEKSFWIRTHCAILLIAKKEGYAMKRLVLLSILGGLIVAGFLVNSGYVTKLDDKRTKVPDSAFADGVKRSRPKTAKDFPVGTWVICTDNGRMGMVAELSADHPTEAQVLFGGRTPSTAKFRP
jgi:hypothetical protein